VTRARSVAMAVALAATVLTQKVGAQQDAPRDTSSATADSATPLALRPSKPLALSPQPQPVSLGWKVVAGLAILGGAAFYLRKRVSPKRLDVGELTIVRRAPIGLRSELLIVNVEGQRLLIGVTPHSIQSLAVLDAEDTAAPVSGEASSPEPAALGDRFAAMLKAADPRDGARGPEGHRADLPEAARGAALAGQARGLAGLRRRG